VAKLEVFGSFCTPEFARELSDINFLVEYLPGQDLGPWMCEHQAFEEARQRLLQTDVDLVFAYALRNHWFRQEAARTRTIIHETQYASDVA
jgi:predicted nucleotidyltransferase